MEADKYFAAAIAWNRTCTVITDNPVSNILGEKRQFHYKLGGNVPAKVPGDNGVKVTYSFILSVTDDDILTPIDSYHH